MQIFLWAETALCNFALVVAMLCVRPPKLKALWIFAVYSLTLDVVCAFALPLLSPDRYNILWQFTDLFAVAAEIAAVVVIFWKYDSNRASYACMFVCVHILLHFAEYSWWDNFVGVDLFNYSLNIAGRKVFEMRQWSKIPATAALMVFIIGLAQPRKGEQAWP